VELPEPEPKTRKRRSARLPLAMIGLSALLTLGAVGFWQTHGSAASLEASSGVRPMIAAAAAPIWRALPEPPQVEPGPPALSVALRHESTPRPNTFQGAFMKPIPPTVSSEVVPATSTRAVTATSTEVVPAASTEVLPPTANEVVPAALDTGNPALVNPVPSANNATTATEGDPSASTVDVVSHRYGL